MKECIAMPYASDTIKKLKNEGNEIFFITARLTSIENCNTEEITKNTLDKYDIPYDNLIINASNKLEFCKENKIQIFIEDSYETCKELQDNNIKAFLMTTKMNENIHSGEIERVSDWKEIYTKILDFIKRKEK